MIDKSLQQVLDKIAEARQRHASWKKSADEHREKAEAEMKIVAEQEAQMKRYELEVEQLSLELRKVLNGLPADLTVASPAVLEEDQVGRIG